MDDAWAQHSIWWQVYPLGFVGAPIREPAALPPPRTLAALIDWLDYLIELGANGLLLGPIFESTSHGYDTLDHYKIDPRLGTDADWDALVAACRAKGIRICLDGVFNHVGAQHRWITEQSDYLSATDFEGHSSLRELNHEHPGVASYVSGVMQHWCDRGADAWRLDAAYATPTQFWTSVLPQVRQAHPDAWIFGEVIHGDYPRFVAESGVDSVTEYELWKAIWSSLREENFFELDWTLMRHNEFLATFCPQTFIGNHDVTRIATQVGADKAVLALAVLCTVGGIPSIYYGDEQGFTATKREERGGDDDIRPAFPGHPSELIGLGTWMYQTHQQLIALRRQHPWLTGAKTEAVELSNKRYTYNSTDGFNTLTTTLDLEAEPSVHVSGDGMELFRF